MRRDQIEHARRRALPRRQVDQLPPDALGADLVQLVDRPVDAARPIGIDAGEQRQGGEELAVVDLDRRLGKPDRRQRLGHDGDRFGVGELARAADDVGVALPELAEAAPLRLLGPPDRGDVVALERQDDLVLVHRHHARQGHGQVVAHPDLAAAGVLEAVHQLLVLAGLAGQDLQVLQRRRVERLEAVALEDLAEGADDALAQDHLRRQVVAESLEDLRLAGS